MNITLISPPLMDYTNGLLAPISMDAVRTCPPYGVYLLAAILRQHGHNVAIVDLVAQGNHSLAPHWGALLTCHLIGFGVSSLSWPTARECIAEIRRWSRDVPIVLGGIHATMFDEYLLATTETTFVIRGEAEVALPELCRALTCGGDLRKVPNLSYKSAAGQIVRNSIAPKLSAQEIAQFPVPDYGAIAPMVYTGLGVESSRGCPFDCCFCSTSYRRTWRAMAPEQFVDRVERILPCVELTTRRLIQIIDDEFSVQTERAIAICTEFGRRRLAPKIVFDARATDLLEAKFVEAIAPYAQQFLIGAECGYDEGLKAVGKGATTSQLEHAAAQLGRFGIAAKADYSFVIGFPWETKAEVMKTVHFALHLFSTYGVRVLLQWYCQIPGSRLWDEQRRNGRVHEAQYDSYGFFRDHYLFRTGVQLAPAEIHEVYEFISEHALRSGSNLNGMPMVQTSVPEPILRNYPSIRGLEEHSSLACLREVAAAS